MTERRRTKSEVLAAQATPAGCCERHADYRSCVCLAMAEDDTFAVNDEVSKATGYQFPGIVRAVFQNGAGETRYVVEHTESPGLLHIFSGSQLTLVARAACKMCGGSGWMCGKDSNDVERCPRCEVTP